MTHGNALYSAFFGDRGDTFMDFFNSVINSTVQDPYVEAHVIYPPFIELVYRAFSHLIPTEVFNGFVLDPTGSTQLQEIKVRQEFVLPFICYSIILIATICLVVYEFRKGNRFNKLFAVCFVLFAYPVLYAIERGNNVLFSVIGLLFFFLWYDSENKVKRELALVGLAISVAIKLYPAIFLLILLIDKRWMEFLRGVLYCIVLTILPFFAFDGLTSLKAFVYQVIDWSSDAAPSGVNFEHAMYILSTRLGISPNQFLLGIVPLLLAGVGVVTSFFAKERWRTVLLLTCIMVGSFGRSARYMMAFLVVPLLLFLNAKKQRSFINYVYLVLFAVLLTMKPYGESYASPYYWETTLSVELAIDCIGMFILTIIATVHSSYDMCTKIKNTYSTCKNKKRQGMAPKLDGAEEK